MNTRKIQGILVAAMGIMAISMVIGGCAACDSCQDAQGVKDESKTVAVVNSVCPIGEDPIDSKAVEASLTRNWRGKKVGFCCEGCLPVWDEMSDADKEKALAGVTGAR